jgi:hypothetical protein
VKIALVQTVHFKGRETFMTTRRTFAHGALSLALAVLVLTTMAPASRAQDLAAPAGEVVLTIEGKIGRQNAPGQADFDLDMLRAMPKVTFRTTSPWTEGAAEFEGVLLADVFKAVAASGTSIKATALNDYIADVDLATVVSAGAILAYRINGADLSVRDKGPLWIMFPFDDKPDLKSELIYSQSVWQLRKMTVLD